MLTQAECDEADFGTDTCTSDCLPHNYSVNSVACTGTHDNETLTGWFGVISEEEHQRARGYLCDRHTPATVGQNRRWRVTQTQLSDALKREMHGTANRCGRLNPETEPAGGRGANHASHAG